MLKATLFPTQVVGGLPDIVARFVFRSELFTATPHPGVGIRFQLGCLSCNHFLVQTVDIHRFQEARELKIVLLLFDSSIKLILFVCKTGFELGNFCLYAIGAEHEGVVVGVNPLILILLHDHFVTFDLIARFVVHRRALCSHWLLFGQVSADTYVRRLLGLDQFFKLDARSDGLRLIRYMMRVNRRVIVNYGEVLRHAKLRPFVAQLARICLGEMFEQLS